MSERETALKEQENAREWQAIAYGDHPATWAALAYYRERGWPVDANTFPERDRCENRIFAFKAGYAAALASPISAPPQESTVAAQLIADDVEWVVNDNAELGVKIGRQFFFCYKGHSLVYDTGTHDDGTPMMWRPVFKREFGECIHPVNYANPTHIGTVSLADSDEWKPLPMCVTAAHCNHHWRCLAECTPSDLKVKTNPCVWRITTGPLGTWVKPSCVEGSIPAPWGTERAKSCHLCGSPLRLVPSEETK